MMAMTTSNSMRVKARRLMEDLRRFGIREGFTQAEDESCVAFRHSRISAASAARGFRGSFELFGRHHPDRLAVLHQDVASLLRDGLDVREDGVRGCSLGGERGAPLNHEIARFDHLHGHWVALPLDIELLE